MSIEGHRIEQREKLNCAAVATKASANQEPLSWNALPELFQLSKGVRILYLSQ